MLDTCNQVLVPECPDSARGSKPSIGAQQPVLRIGPTVLVLGNASFTGPTLRSIVRGAGMEVAQIDDGAWYGRPESDQDVCLALKSGLSEPWWINPKAAMLELTARQEEIRTIVTEFASRTGARALILADDNGPLEALILSVVEECGIPALHIEHGIPFGLRGALAMRKRLLLWQFVPKSFEATNQTWVRRNSKYVVGVSTPLDALRFWLAGVSLSRLRMIGWPTERLRSTKGSSLTAEGLNHAKDRTEVLFAPTGWSLFSPGSQAAKRFWDEAERLCASLQRPRGGPRIVLRTKPGDCAPPSFVSNAGVSVCECKSGPTAIASHGIAITDSSSVMIEASRLGIPVFRIGEFASGSRRLRFLVPHGRFADGAVGGVFQSVIARGIRRVLVVSLREIVNSSAQARAERALRAIVYGGVAH